MKLKTRMSISLYLLALYNPIVNANEDFESLLSMSLQELMQIEISSASKTELTVDEIPASVVIINRQDIKRYGYNSLEEVIKNIPGMYMTEDWAWFGSVNYGVRGLYSKGHFDNMAILVNGVSQMEDGKRGYPLEKINVPVQAIDRVEVIRGPMSVIYGSSAFMGVINIITNLESPEGKENTLSFSKGSHGAFKTFARFSGSEGSFSYVFNAQKQSIDGPDHTYSEMLSDTSTLPTDWNLTGDSEVRLKNESQYFDFSGKFKDLNIYFSYVEAEANVIDSQPGVGAGSTGSTNATNLSLDYTKVFNDSWQLKGKASFLYNNYFLDEEYNFTGFFSNNQSATDAHEYELNLLWTPSNSVEALFGIVHRTGNYRAYDDYPTFSLANRELLVPESDGLNTNALFTQINYKPLDDLTIVAGLRAEWQEDYTVIIYDDNVDINNQNVLSRNYSYDDISYTPQLAGIYNIKKNQHLKLMYNRGEKAPSPANNSSILELSQPPLEPEKIETIEISYIISQQDFFLQLGLFQNNVSDLIISSAVIENGSFVSSLSNIGEAETLGLELTTTAQLTKSFKLNFDISLHDVEDKTAGYENIELAYSPSVISNLRATYSFTRDVHLSLLGHYVDSVLAEWETSSTGNTITERINNGSRSGDEIDAYSHYDINLVVQNLFISNMDFSLKVGNLTDETIRYPTINNKTFDKGTIGLGQNVLATLEYFF